MGGNVPQRADKAIDSAFRVEGNYVSNVKKTGPVVWHVSPTSVVIPGAK